MLISLIFRLAIVHSQFYALIQNAPPNLNQPLAVSLAAAILAWHANVSRLATPSRICGSLPG